MTEKPMPGAAPDGAREAATVILLRDGTAGGRPEILMLERACGMAFAAGAMVFPGGAVDPADRALADRLAHGLTPEDAAARIAAIRETLEESGLAIGLDRALSQAEAAAARAALAAGQSLADALAQVGAAVALAALEPFARWCPPADAGHKRRFDTRFYLARAELSAMGGTIDGTENVRMRWASAADMLADIAAGRERAIFPTRCNLERLALYDGFDAAVAHARGHPPALIAPWVEQRDGIDHLCIPEGLGYPVTAAPLAGLARG